MHNTQYDNEIVGWPYRKRALQTVGIPSKVTDNGSHGKIVIYLPDMNNKDADKKRYINAIQPVEYISPGNNEYKKTKSFYVSPLGNIFAWKME